MDSDPTTATPRPTELISIVIPAYNEENRLGGTLKHVHKWLHEHFERFEVIVVDDGSTDATSRTVEAFALSAPQVRLIRIHDNTGKGYAVRTGMLSAEGQYVVFTDADLSTPIEEVDKALDLLQQGYDVVIGSRALPGSDVQVHQNVVRETMGRIFNVFVRVMVGLPFSDTQCGFKCYTRRAAREIFSRTVVKGFAFDVETLAIAGRLGFRATDMPVRWINSPESKVKMFSSAIQMIWELFRIRLNLARGRYA